MVSDTATPAKTIPVEKKQAATPAINPLSALENSLIYPASKFPEGNWSPRLLGQEEINFTSGDGTKLHGWLVRARKPKAVVLYSHGNGGNITHRAPLLRKMRDELNLTVFAFDYRGYGKSEGTPTEAGLLQDARAARSKLSKLTGVAEKEILLWGRSLGGAVAVDLAVDGARGLIIESTFASFPEVAKKHVWIPSGLITNRYASIEKIAKYRGPLLQSHGTADSLIPYEQGQRLHKAANKPKQFVPITGADHNAPQTKEYYRAVVKFLDGLKG